MPDAARAAFQVRSRARPGRRDHPRFRHHLRAFPQINESGVCGSELLTIPLRLVLAYCRFMIDITSIRERYTALSQHLDERGRRVFAATEAKTAGYGGIAALSRATGIAASTIGRGLKELVAAEVLDPGRGRRPGGGGKKRVMQIPRCGAICWRLSSRTRAAIRCHRCAGPARACRN